MEKNPLTNHSRRLDAAIPIQFTMSSCKRQKYYARSRRAKQPWSNHYNAFCNFRFQTRISRRTWQHKTTTIMQPLHCDLQPESQETHKTTHTWTTTHCRTQRRNQSRPVRAQPHPPHMATQNDNDHAAVTLRSATRESRNAKNYAHMSNHSLCRTQRRNQSRPVLAQPHPAHTRGTFHRRPEPLYTEKHKVSCPGFPPKRSPCNIHAAITMRFATSGSKPASLDAHGNTKRQRSCSRYSAICSQRVKKRKELRTHEQPLIAEHRGGINRARFERSRTRRTHQKIIKKSS